LKRAAFIGAASGYFLATLASSGGVDLFSAITQGRSARLIAFAGRSQQLPNNETEALRRMLAQYDGRLALSLHQFRARPNGSLETPNEAQLSASSQPKAAGDGLLVYSRKPEPRGPLAVFGYDYFAEHAKPAGLATPKLLSYEGLWGAGEEYAYEVLNFADGKRNAQEIRDAVSAEYGPVPLELVVEYLKALERIRVIEQVK
jgi:aminopeptidase YwaD